MIPRILWKLSLVHQSDTPQLEESFGIYKINVLEFIITFFGRFACSEKLKISSTRILEMSHATKMIVEGYVMGRSTRQKLFSKKLVF